MSENRFDIGNNENENIDIQKIDDAVVEMPLTKGEIAKKRILAILKALAYTLLFFGMQIIVSTAFAVFFSLVSKGDEEKYLELYNDWSNFIVFLSGLLSLIAVFCIYVPSFCEFLLLYNIARKVSRGWLARLFTTHKSRPVGRLLCHIKILLPRFQYPQTPQARRSRRSGRPLPLRASSARDACA